jgi:clan AA aspartic protease
MGIIYSQIELSNPKNNLKPIKTKALVDTGAIHLCIPEHIALQLEFEELEKREAVLADGRKEFFRYVGPVEIKFEDRHCFTGALVLGDSVLLGAIPLEDMDLIINPSQKKLTVNPENPNFPLSIVK